MPARLHNVAPDALADPGTPGGPGFTLARPEWIAIQAASTDARALPAAAGAFRRSLGPGVPADLSDLDRLLETYATMRAQATAWSEKTYPACVALAGDVQRFGQELAPVYFPRIDDEADLLRRDPHDDQARTALRTLLLELAGEAERASDRADTAAGAVATAAAGAEQVETTLVGDDDAGGLSDYYARRYAAARAEVGSLVGDVSAQRRLVRPANDDHDRDVVITSATASYVWVWPLGMVAAPVVAGGYGREAALAVVRAQCAHSRIRSLGDEAAVAARLLIGLDGAVCGATALVRGLTETLPVIRRIRGVWGGIAADLRAVAAVLSDDAAAVPALIEALDVEGALRSWTQVARRAQAYRLVACVDQPTGPSSMGAWQLATQVSSPRSAQPAMAARR